MSPQLDRKNDHLPERGFSAARALEPIDTVCIEKAEDVLAALHFNEDNEQAHILALDVLSGNLRADLLRIEKEPVLHSIMNKLQEDDRLLCAASPRMPEKSGYRRALLYLTSAGFVISRSETIHQGDETFRREEDQHLRFENILPGRHLSKDQLADLAYHRVTGAMVIANLIAHGRHHGFVNAEMEARLSDLLQDVFVRRQSTAA